MEEKYIFIIINNYTLSIPAAFPYVQKHWPFIENQRSIKLKFCSKRILIHKNDCAKR